MRQCRSPGAKGAANETNGARARRSFNGAFRSERHPRQGRHHPRIDLAARRVQELLDGLGR
jgi:hypothetical protein